MPVRSEGGTGYYVLKLSTQVLLLSCSISGFSLSAYALSAKSGSSGFFALGRSHTEITDNTTAKVGGVSFQDGVIRGYNNLPLKATGQNRFFAGFISYRFTTTGTRLFAGYSPENWLRLRPDAEAGFSQTLPAQLGELGLAYLPEDRRMSFWSDPYLKNMARVATDVRNEGWRLIFDKIAGSNFGVNLSGNIQQIQNEQSGYSQNLTPDQKQELNRNGGIYISEMLYRANLSDQHQLVSAVRFVRNGFKGKAVSSDEKQLQLTYIWSGQYLRLVSNFFAGNKIYDQGSSLFNMVRQTGRMNGFAQTIFFRGMPGFYGWNTAVSASHFESVSNIAFHNKTTRTARVFLMYEI